MMVANSPKVLVIEDDPQIRRFLKVSLEGKGYVYSEASLAKEALQAISDSSPDIIILDLGLPDMDGQDFLSRLREWSQIPVIVLTARDREQDKINALDQGADDYLTKPFSVGELMARIRVALRHTAQSATEQGPVFETGKLKIDTIKRQVFVGDQEVRLTPIEYKILVFLSKYADRVITQHQLMKEVWGNDFEDQGNALRVYVHQLRHKLEENPSRPKWIINEPGVGYRLKMESPK